MFKIYCLLDPRTNYPFYIGVTRHELSARLKGHLRDAQQYYTNNQTTHLRHEKANFIYAVIKSGNTPEIFNLIEVDSFSVDYYERFFYEHFKQQGYKMIQDEKRFYYNKSQQGKRFITTRNKKLLPVLASKLNQLCQKDY